MTERTISIYDADDAATIENGTAAAKETTDAETHGAAVAELAAAFTGWSAEESSTNDDDA